MQKRIVITINVEAEEGDFPDKNEIATALSGVLQNKAGDPFLWGNATVYGGVQGLLLDAVEGSEGLEMPEMLTIPFRMPIQNGDEKGNIAGRIEIGPLGVEVFVDGYGMRMYPPYKGSVVFLNHFDGSPQLVVHGDINQDDCTHRIQLSSASEAYRDQPYAPMPRYAVESYRLPGERRASVVYDFNRPGKPTIPHLHNHLSENGYPDHLIQSVLNPMDERDVREQAHAAFEATRRAEGDYHRLGTCIATWMAEQGLSDDKQEGE